MTVKGMSSLKKAEIPPRDLSDEGKCLLAAEEEANAIQTYLNMADNTSDERLKDNFQEVAEDEMEHLGKDLTTAMHIRPELAEYMSKGADEAKEEGFDIDEAIRSKMSEGKDERTSFDDDIDDARFMRSIGESSSPEATLYMAFVKADRMGKIKVTRGFLNWLTKDSESFIKARELSDFRTIDYGPFDEEAIGKIISDWNNVHKQSKLDELLSNALKKLKGAEKYIYRKRPTSQDDLDSIKEGYESVLQEDKKRLVNGGGEFTIRDQKQLSDSYHILELIKFINFLISRGAKYPKGFGTQADQSDDEPSKSTEEVSVDSDWFSGRMRAIEDYLKGLSDDEREDLSLIWDILQETMSTQMEDDGTIRPEEMDKFFDDAISELLGDADLKKEIPEEELFQKLGDISKVRHLINIFRGESISPEHYVKHLLEEINSRVNDAMAEFNLKSLEPNTDRDKENDGDWAESDKQKENDAVEKAITDVFKDPSIMAQLYWLKTMGVDTRELFNALNGEMQGEQLFGLERERLGNAVSSPYKRWIALTQTPVREFGMDADKYLKLRDEISNRPDVYFPVKSRNEFNGVNYNRYNITDTEPLIRHFAQMFADKEAARGKKPGKAEIKQKHLAMAFNFANLLGLPYRREDPIRTDTTDGVLDVDSLADESDATRQVRDILNKHGKGNVWNSVKNENVYAPTDREINYYLNMLDNVRQPGFLKYDFARKGLNKFLKAVKQKKFLSDLIQSAKKNKTSEEGLEELVDILRSGNPLTYSMLNRILSNDTLTNILLGFLNEDNIFGRDYDITPESLASSIADNRIERLRDFIFDGLNESDKYLKIYDDDKVFREILDEIYDGNLDVIDDSHIEGKIRELRNAGKSKREITEFTDSVNQVKDFLGPLLSVVDGSILSPIEYDLSDTGPRQDVAWMRKWMKDKNKKGIQGAIDAAWALTDNDVKRQKVAENVRSYKQLADSRPKMMESIPILVMNDLVESIPPEALENIQMRKAIQAKKELTPGEKRYVALSTLGRKIRDGKQPDSPEEWELYEQIQEIQEKQSANPGKRLSFKDRQDISAFDSLDEDEILKDLAEKYSIYSGHWSDDKTFTEWAKTSPNPAIRFIGTMIENLNANEPGLNTYMKDKKDNRTDWSRGPDVAFKRDGMYVPVSIPWYRVANTNFFRDWFNPMMESLKKTAGYGGGDVSNPQDMLNNLYNLRNSQVKEQLERKKMRLGDEGYSYFPWVDPGMPVDKKRIFSLNPNEDVRLAHGISDEDAVTQFLPEFLPASVDENGKPTETVMDRLLNSLLFASPFDESESKKFSTMDEYDRYRKEHAQVHGNDQDVLKVANSERKGGKNAKKREYIAQKYGAPIGWVDDHGARHFFDSSDEPIKDLGGLAYNIYKNALDAEYNKGAREYLDKMIMEPGYAEYEEFTGPREIMGISDSFMKPNEYVDQGWTKDSEGNEVNIRTPRHRMGVLDVSPGQLLMRYAISRFNNMYPEEAMQGARLDEQLPPVVFATSHTKDASDRISVPNIVSQAFGAFVDGLINNEDLDEDYADPLVDLYGDTELEEDKGDKDKIPPLRSLVESFANVTGKWDDYADTDKMVADNIATKEMDEGTSKSKDNGDQEPSTDKNLENIANIQADKEKTDMEKAIELAAIGNKGVNRGTDAEPVNKSNGSHNYIEGAKTRILDPSLDRDHIHSGRPAPMWQPVDYVISLQDPDREYVEEDEVWDIDKEIEKRQKK